MNATTTTSTTSTSYRPLPQLAPRCAGETTEQYGLRALLFITAERQTATIDTDTLALADHVFSVAVAHHDLSPVAAENLADVRRLITGDLRRRYARQAAQAPVQAAQAPAGEDKPNLGPGAPLAPQPAPQAPPSAARRVSAAPKPAPVPVTGPAAIPARYTAVSPALGARLAPVAPSTVSAEDLF